MVFRHLNIKSPTKRQYEIADRLQYGPKRQIISAFRGIGKSYITACYVLWRLYRNKKINVLIISASKKKSDEIASFCFKLMTEIPELNHMVPDKKVDRVSRVAFDVAGASASQSTSLSSMGVFGQLTGARADVIVLDDVETPGTSETQGMREKLSGRVEECESILKPIKTAQVIALGTPQTEDSLYNEMVKRSYKRMLWPARYPDKKWLNNNGHELAPSILEDISNNPSLQTGYGLDGTLGAPTDPERFNDDDLNSREAAFARSGFTMQFMLDTTLSDQDRYPLKTRDLMIMDFDDTGPDHPVWSPGTPLEGLANVGFRGDNYYAPASLIGSWRPWEGSVMAIDPAGRGNDELAYAVVKQLNGFLYLAEVNGLMGGYEESNLEILAKAAERHKCSKIIIESNFGDGMFTKLLHPVLGRIYRCTTEEIRSSKQKEKRIIDVLEPVMTSHKLVVSKEVVRKDTSDTKELGRQLFYQLTRLTREKGCLSHDDRIDVVAMGVAYFKNAVAKDISKSIEIQRLRDIDNNIKSFWDTADKNKNKGNTWISGITRRR
jgi:hypothetical protein